MYIYVIIYYYGELYTNHLKKSDIKFHLLSLLLSFRTWYR